MGRTDRDYLIEHLRLMANQLCEDEYASRASDGGVLSKAADEIERLRLCENVLRKFVNADPEIYVWKLWISPEDEDQFLTIEGTVKLTEEEHAVIAAVESNNEAVK